MQDQITNNRSVYLATVKELILQSMIKMIEPTLQVKCRKGDFKDLQAMTGDLESQYKSFMHQNTGRDEYDCVLTVIDGNFLTEAQDQGCGGVIIYTADSKIVCPNTLHNRLGLAFEELLPQIRSGLFPVV